VSSQRDWNRAGPHVLRGIAAVACLALSVAMVACGGGDEGESDSGSGGDSGNEKIVMGAATQLSGSLQIYGAPAVQGMEAGAKDINAKGGVKAGGKSYEITVAAKDNRSDPSQVVNSARAVVDAGAIATLGPDIGGAPAYEVFKSKDVITFTPAFDLQLQLIEKPDEHPLLFSPVPFLAELFETNMKQLAAELPEIKTVAILAPNHEEGQGAAAAYADAAKNNGFTVVGNEGYPPNGTDFTSVLTSFKRQKPDLVIALQSAEQGIAILQQAAQLGVAKYGLNDVLTPDQVQDAQGLDKMTVIIPNFSPTFSPSATIPDYHPEVVFGTEEPAGNPGAAIDFYYAMFLLKQAIEDAGTATDAAAIAKELPGQSYDGPFGKCTMSERKELDCETLLDIVRGDEITVYRFPTPDSVEATDVYTCRGGDCKSQ
jgi:ABC-type branched-subunit amino acid transport system substrate-binding protein